MGVRADARTDDDELATQPLTDGGVDLLGGQERVVALVDGDLGEVDEVGHRAVDDEEGVRLADGGGVHEQGRIQAHLPGELQRPAVGELAVRDGQAEGQLDHAVPGRVAVRTDDRRLVVAGQAVAHRAAHSSSASIAGLL